MSFRRSWASQPPMRRSIGVSSGRTSGKRGAWSRNFAGRFFSHRSGGSAMWESAEISTSFLAAGALIDSCSIWCTQAVGRSYARADSASTARGAQVERVRDRQPATLALHRAGQDPAHEVLLEREKDN